MYLHLCREFILECSGLLALANLYPSSHHQSTMVPQNLLYGTLFTRTTASPGSLTPQNARTHRRRNFRSEL